MEKYKQFTIRNLFLIDFDTASEYSITQVHGPTPSTHIKSPVFYTVYVRYIYTGAPRPHVGRRSGLYCDRAPPPAPPPRRSPVRAVSRSRHRPPPKHSYTHFTGLSSLTHWAWDTRISTRSHAHTPHLVFLTQKNLPPPPINNRNLSL